MPIEFHYDEVDGVLYETGHGDLTVADFMEYCAELAEYVLPEELRVLSDYCNARLHFTYDEVVKIRSTYADGETSSGYIREALCVSTQMDFGMARMYCQMAESSRLEIKPFRSLAEGREWLGLPPLD